MLVHGKSFTHLNGNNTIRLIHIQLKPTYPIVRISWLSQFYINIILTYNHILKYLILQIKRMN